MSGEETVYQTYNKAKCEGSKEGPCGRAGAAGPFHRDPRSLLESWHSEPGQTDGSGGRRVPTWEREKTQRTQALESEIPMFLPLVLTTLSKIKKTSFKVEPGSPEGGALRHCLPRPTREEGLLFAQQNTSIWAKHLDLGRNLIGGLPSGWAPGYRPTNENGPFSQQDTVTTQNSSRQALPTSRFPL